MLARAHTFTIDGLRARHVTVEVDIRRGLPAFTIVGLADPTVREARERVRAAILNCGFQFPARRITANLAPGDLPKAGPALDLALACAILAASEQLSPDVLNGYACFGELSLDGGVRACRGTLAVAQATAEGGSRGLLLALEAAREAALVDGLDVAPVAGLGAAVRVLRGGQADPLPATGAVDEKARRHNPKASPPEALDLGEVRGQDHAVRALTIAAAGGHNLLLSGPPGTGKTMLAQRMPSILPALSRREAIEVTKVHSIAGHRVDELAHRRPFRAPHHSVTTAGLMGGADRGRLGEVVLAHNGVLFLDELSEFARPALEALRQPLEDGVVTIARARHTATFRTRFMLVAATNPCPCGYAGVAERCRCSEGELARHRRRLSGALLDRIDVLVHPAHGRAHDLQAPPTLSSRTARERVACARERQTRRLRDDGVRLNAQMDARLLSEHVRLDETGEGMLRRAHEGGLLSARGQHRVLRVARTIADLDGRDRVRSEDLGTALGLRSDAGLAGEQAP